MSEILWAALGFVIRLIGCVLEAARWITDLRRFAREISGSNKLVEVPPDPKFLSPAAQRALAEADMRRSKREAAAQAGSSPAA